MKRTYILLTLVAFLLIGFLLSPFSYFYVTFKQPFTPGDFLIYLDEYNIDPVEHEVFVLHSQLERPEGISRTDMMIDSRMVTDAVFNTKPYAVKALFDNRIQQWEFAGPEHPYD